MARGAPGNAGGGGTDPEPGRRTTRTAGGGGGANGGDGGMGGNSWDSNVATGGVGGDAHDRPHRRPPDHGRRRAARATGNNCGPSHGGAGGGIVMIRAGLGERHRNDHRARPDRNDVRPGWRGRRRRRRPHRRGGGDGHPRRPHHHRRRGARRVHQPQHHRLRRRGSSPPADLHRRARSHGPGGGGGGGAIFLSDGPTGPASMSVAGGPSGLTNVVDGSAQRGRDRDFGATAGAAGFTNTGVTAARRRAALHGGHARLRVRPARGSRRARWSSRPPRSAAPSASSSTRRKIRPAGRAASLLTERPILSPVPSSGTPILYRAETDADHRALPRHRGDRDDRTAAQHRSVRGRRRAAAPRLRAHREVGRGTRRGRAAAARACSRRGAAQASPVRGPLRTAALRPATTGRRRRQARGRRGGAGPRRLVRARRRRLAPRPRGTARGLAPDQPRAGRSRSA